jgi:hypothetical protein
LPELPEEFADRLPIDPASFGSTVISLDASFYDGYDDARQAGFGAAVEGSIVVQEAPARIVRSVPPGGF